MNQTLHVRHDYRGHLWCGIGALSAALEIPTSEAKQLIQSTAMRKFIKAITYGEMNHALAEAGHDLERVYYPRDPTSCPTLKEWIGLEYRPANRVYVICITGHWIVIKNDQWVCSMNQNARSVDDCPYLRSRVRFEVSFDGGGL